MKHILFLFIVLVFTGTASMAQNTAGKSLISTSSFSDSLQTKKAIVILDVRTPDEFNNGHLKTALNYDVKNADFKRNIEKLDKAKTYYVYCRSGNRSAIAVKEMRLLGFNNIYEMEGGMLKWVADGMQTVKEAEKLAN